jgi:hypothetical protein
MTKPVILSVRVDPETLGLLERAEAAGLGSRSELVRTAIRRHIGSEARPPHPLEVLGERIGCFSGPRDLATSPSKHLQQRIRNRVARPR